jgi:NAD(P) transhydrogenase subunit beta
LSAQVVQFAYLAAAVLFILGLHNLSSPRTAPRGNVMAAVGMLIAIVATLLVTGVVDYVVILAGVVVGSTIGAVLALRIQMTAMPQMVALLNGFGGAASALVASAELFGYMRRAESPEGVVPIAIVLGVLIGGLTFTGSVIAFAKLQELMRGAPITYPGQQVVNAVLGLGAIALCAGVVLDPFDAPVFSGLIAMSLVLGVLLVIPIGGLRHGLRARQQRPRDQRLAGRRVGDHPDEDHVRRDEPLPCQRAVRGLWCGGRRRRRVGRRRRSRCRQGLHARHAVRELADELEARGVRVKYAVHPVAGRMPGHMNVLLAEADVPYEQLIEMDEINPEVPETDLALVIGANDVVNPDARTEKSSPIFGMPILDVDRAKHVFVLKRSMNPGFAGVQNPLFYNDNTMMVFGDAKQTVLKMVEAVRNFS